MKIKEKIVDAVMALAGALPQGQGHHNPVKAVTPGMPELLRSVAAQGAVLLENRVLPLASGTRVALFGRTQNRHFCTGYGSGGDVNAPYRVNVAQALEACPELALNRELAQVYRQWEAETKTDEGVWGFWPRSWPEMPLTEALVARAAEASDTAVVIIGRAAGEDRENVLRPGSFYLTEEEKRMLALVTEKFPDTVLLLNIGSIMDLSFVKDYSLGAVVLLWQGGMESGNAAADLLCGRENPSGRLTDTVAASYQDYPSAGHFGGRKRNEYFEDIYVGYRYFETFAPEKVLYPFGHGLSYTEFSLEPEALGELRWQVTVTNTGSLPGRETALLYGAKPCGVLGTPARELLAFGKTKLLAPGESQTLTLSVDREQLGVFDDTGLTGYRNAWVLQGGTYEFFLGGDVRQARPLDSLTVPETELLRQVTEQAAPETAFPILARQALNGRTVTVPRRAAARTASRRQVILDKLPPALFQTGDKGYKLRDVKENRVSMDAFVAQLSLEELEAISRGAYIMGHPLGARGNAGIFGGVTESLRKKGVPPVVTTDGPSGIRLYDSCSLLPIGTLLACTFDEKLLEQVFRQVGLEMRARGSDVLLAPGMNIHRDPLCGRNFEYFSEDPLVSGRIAGAVVRGIQSVGLSACPKHFACNNQEYNRTGNDSVVSQRALREIYLRGFRICVEEAGPKNLMTSYNKINGVWGHYHYDLVAGILRGEWGYRGNVITDWWMRPARSREFPRLRDNAYRVRSQVDVLMPGSRRIDLRKKPDGTLLATLGKKNGITLGELQLCAKHILQCVMEIKELTTEC